MIDFHQILSLLKEVQSTHDENFEEYSRNRWTSFFFLSALIGFQLRDMLSNPADKKMVTDVLKIKEIGILQRNVKAEIRFYYVSRVSLDFFKNRKTTTEVDFMHLLHAVTNFEDDSRSFFIAYDALEKFYEGLN